MLSFKEMLNYMVKQDGSDLYLTVGAAPSIKVHGQLLTIGKDILNCDHVRDFAMAIMNDKQKTEFEKSPEMNLAISENGVGRFRVNIFQQRNQIGIVVRNIKMEIPTLQSLGVPESLKNLVMLKNGLVLIVGATGTGKSTTLASLIDHRNQNSSGHIISVEDPIEYVHRHQRSIVNQREIGVDTRSYGDALKNTLRQAPDVILIGEIRDQETMQHAIAFSETGHLCLSTLHAANSDQALERIINLFPSNKRKQILLDLSINLRAIVSQRLIPTVDGKRAASFEIMIVTPLISDFIHRDELHEIREVMKKSEVDGMQTFDGSLYSLYKQKKISYDEALRNADSANNLKLRITLEESPTAVSSNLSILSTDDSCEGNVIYPSMSNIGQTRRKI